MVKNESGHHVECLDSHLSVIGLGPFFGSLYIDLGNGQIFYVTTLGFNGQK